VDYAVKRIAAILALLLIPLMLSSMLMNTVHAVTMTGNLSGSWTETKMIGLVYGETVYVYTGAFSGKAVGIEMDQITTHPYGGISQIVENFTGGFNGSQQGTITFHDTGHYTGSYGANTYVTVTNYWASSFKNGTGGLAGLQGNLTGISSGPCNDAGTACTYKGAYNITSATWGTTPVPEFSTPIVPMLPLLFASIVCLTTLRRRKTH
jgi:hypothetical protein